jgi:hypothetical protein
MADREAPEVLEQMVQVGEVAVVEAAVPAETVPLSRLLLNIVLFRIHWTSTLTAVPVAVVA